MNEEALKNKEAKTKALRDKYLKHMESRKERLGSKSTDDKVFDLLEGGDKVNLFQPDAFAGIDTTGQNIDETKAAHWTVKEMFDIYRDPKTSPELKEIIQIRLAKRGIANEAVSAYEPGKYKNYETSILGEDDEETYNVKIRFNPIDDTMVTDKRVDIMKGDDTNPYFKTSQITTKEKKKYRGKILGKDGNETGYTIVGDIGTSTSGEEHAIPTSDDDVYGQEKFKLIHSGGPRKGEKRGYEVTTPDGEVVFIKRDDLETFLTNIGAM